MRSLSNIVTTCFLAALAAGCGGNNTGPAGPPGEAGAQGLIGKTGETGKTGATGEAGAQGEPGKSGVAGDASLPPLVGTIGGTVVSAVDSRPLPGVTVTLSLVQGATLVAGDAAITDAGAPQSTTTDVNGKFTLSKEPLAAYQATFAAPGFVTKTVTVSNTIAGPTILAVTLATNAAATSGIVGQAAASTSSTADAPTFQLTVSSSNGGSDPYTVGFGTTVTVDVTAFSNTSTPYDAGAFKYAWKLSTAPTTTNPGGTYTFNSTPTASSAAFTTLTLAQTKAVEMYAYKSPVADAGIGYVGRLGVLGINPDETGNYTVSVTATDPEGHFYSFSQPIRSTWQTPNIANVAVGNPVYLQGDTFAAPNWLNQSPSFWKWPNTSWAWTLTAPAGSTATISGGSTQYPSFVPDVVGTYTLNVTEKSAYAPDAMTGPGGGNYVSSTGTVTVYAGTYEGVMNGGEMGCASCHTADAGAYLTPGLGAVHVTGGFAPDYFTPWQNTAHATALQRKMDGYVGAHFGESCMQCHTLGWSNAATADTNKANGGFTYAMTQKNQAGNTWSFPASITTADGGPVPGDAGAYAQMVETYPALAPLAGIQCENCHGPAGPSTGPAAGHPGSLALYEARVDWSAQLCASCHEEKNSHYFPGQWGPSEHGNLEVAVQRASVESKSTTYGGGADPQSGAQFCGRCHSAQGFVQYSRMLSNFPVGRYDFITMDDQKLGATNAPTTAWLSSIGLNAAQVQSQTCVTCHDPHSNNAYGAAKVDCTQQANYTNTACAQLRLYDTVPGLPDGQGAISGVGAGLVCMACHNGRNGEHTDTVNSSPYAETPHDSTATEALFGFNAFFVPRYNPSPHLAIQDTCVGCHIKLPTAAETALGETGDNHSFATDLSICNNCHGSTAVNGAALQDQVANDLAALGSMISAKEKADVTALAAANGLCVRASSISDPACTGGSCASSQVPTAVPFPIAPSNVWIPAGTISAVSFTSPSDSASITLKANSGITIPYFDPKVNITGPAINTLPNATVTTCASATSTCKLSVAIYTIQVGTGGVSGATSCGAAFVPAAPFAANTQTVQGTAYAGYVYLPSTVTAKAVWNYNMLTNEGSGGIHNFPWTNAVLGATEEAIQNAITNGQY